MYRIGWFSTGRDEAAANILQEVWNFTKECKEEVIIEFLFCNREEGDSPKSDHFLELAREINIKVLSFSSKKFMPEKKKLAKTDSRYLEEWRKEYDSQVAKMIQGFEFEIIIMAGYMLFLSDEMCNRYDFINLHPAPPNGPIGTWQEVITQLIRTRADTAGATIQLATPERDRGPLIAFCTFPITGAVYEELWKEVEAIDLEQLTGKEIEELRLFKKIREDEFAREIPLMKYTIEAFAEGKTCIRNKQVIVDGRRTATGLDLTKFVDAELRGVHR
jgi:phosphoribosylglycinamide formyltransferase-1